MEFRGRYGRHLSGYETEKLNLGMKEKWADYSAQEPKKRRLSGIWKMDITLQYNRGELS